MLAEVGTEKGIMLSGDHDQTANFGKEDLQPADMILFASDLGSARR